MSTIETVRYGSSRDVYNRVNAWSWYATVDGTMLPGIHDRKADAVAEAVAFVAQAEGTFRARPRYVGTFGKLVTHVESFAWARTLCGKSSANMLPRESAPHDVCARCAAAAGRP